MKNVTQHTHDKWLALRTKLLEADIKETDLIHRIAEFLRKILRQSAPQKTPHQHPQTETHPKIEMLNIAETPQLSLIATQTEPSFVDEASTSYEVSKRRLKSSDGETSYGDNDVRGVYEVSSPYLNKMRLLDEQYGIRRDGNTLMIGNASVNADEDDITIEVFERNEGIMGTLHSQKRQ